MQPDAAEPPGRPDLRLAGVAAAVWLSALAGLYLSWRASAAVAGGAGIGTAAGGWWLVRRHVGRRSRAGWVVLAVLVGVFAGAGVTAARVAVRDAQPLAGLARERATLCVALEVDDDPRPVRTPTGRPAEVAVPVSLRELCGPPVVRVSARILVLAADPAWRTLLPGQRLTASGRLATARGGDLRAAVLSAAGPPRDVRAAPWVQRAAGSLRAGLQRACAPLPSDRGGLLPGLVVGDTSRLDPAVADDFRTTGMTHLVAVSGPNVGIGIVVAVPRIKGCKHGAREVFSQLRSLMVRVEGE